MPDEDQLYDLAEIFKVFGDSTRIKILYVLFESEMCVCDIAQLLNMNQSAISHQLRILKAEPSGEEPAGGKGRILFSGGQPCKDHTQSGYGSYIRVRI